MSVAWWNALRARHDALRNVDTLTATAALLMPMLTQNERELRDAQHSGVALVHRVLQDDEVTEIMESKEFDAFQKSWATRDLGATVRRHTWASERNKDPYLFRILMAILAATENPTFAHEARRMFDRCGTVRMDVAGGRYYANISMVDPQTNAPSTLAIRYATKEARFIRLCVCMGADIMLLLPSMPTQHIEGLITALFLGMRHSPTFLSPTRELRWTSAFAFEHEIRVEGQSGVNLALQPLWEAGALLDQILPARLPEAICAWIGKRVDFSHIVALPQAEPFAFKLRFVLFTSGRYQARADVTAAYLAYHAARGTAPRPNIPIEALSGDMRIPDQELMKLTIVPKTLRFPASTDTTLPLVRGSRTSGPFHYPFERPAELKTEMLTQAQVVTQEFMQERETMTFMDLLGEREVHEGKTSVLSPYLVNLLTPYGALNAEVTRIGGGIIADETGTGKTLSIIARCIRNRDDRTLIVVPDVLMIHWSSEIAKHTTLRTWEDARYANAQQGDAPRQKRARPNITAEAYDAIVLHRTLDMRAHKFEHLPRLLLITHSVLTSQYATEKLRQMVFRRVVVDEGHHVRGVIADRICEVRRDCTWVVSATPYENTPILCRLLQMDKVIVTGESKRGLPLIYRYCTIRNELDRTHLEIEVIKQYCEMTPQETEFFAEIIEMFNDIRCTTLYNIGRFFRILERLGAGGYVHRALILQILRKCFDRPVKRRPDNNNPYGAPRAAEAHKPTRLDTVATQKAFGAPGDDCTVCLCPFNEPVQARCGHVYCFPCLASMHDLRMTLCAFCRQETGTQWAKPNWDGAAENKKDKKRKADSPPGAAAAAAAAAGPAADPAAPNPRGDVRNPMRGVTEAAAAAAAQGELINMHGKNIEMCRQLDNFVRTRAAGDQLVMFTKEQVPAGAIVREIQARGLTVLCAGVMDTRKLASVANIERFRQGQADVLLISNKYCDGFDLFMAREIWLLNTDLSAARMEQSQGRIMRVAQRHPKVTVRVFVYRNAFDDFLWEFRKQLKAGYTRSHVKLFHYFATREDPHSIAHAVDELVRKLLPDFQGWPSAVPRHDFKFANMIVDMNGRQIMPQNERRSVSWHVARGMTATQLKEFLDDDG